MALRTVEEALARKSRKKEINLLSAQYSVKQINKQNPWTQTINTITKLKAKQQTTKNLNWVTMGRLQCIGHSMANWYLYWVLTEGELGWHWSVIRRQNFRKTLVLQSMMVNVTCKNCILSTKSWYWEVQRPLKPAFRTNLKKN